MSWLEDAKKCIDVVNTEKEKSDNKFDKAVDEILENLNKLERNEENFEFLQSINNITRR